MRVEGITDKTIKKRDHFLICSHGCFRHSAAVARTLGLNSSIGVRNSANSRASLGVHSYFSVSTSYRPHGFNTVICFSSPFLLKYIFEFLPESAIRLGISPNNSII